MDTDPSPVRLWDSEHSEGYRTASEQPSESEETARPPTRANTAPKPALKHDAEGFERPARARTAPEEPDGTDVPCHQGSTAHYDRLCSLCGRGDPEPDHAGANHG